MRFTLRAFSRYRPRVLTLLLLFVIVAVIGLANLSHEVRGVDEGDFRQGGLRRLSFGWPLAWCQYLVFSSPGPAGLVGWYYSLTRLIGNAVAWLVLLVAAGLVCEWLVRRYRPRLRWSVRTMLLAMGIAAALCAWFASARRRADLQDEIIAAVEARGGQVWVERTGPAWLELVGADRYRRHITGVELGTNTYSGGLDDEDDGDLGEDEDNSDVGEDEANDAVGDNNSVELLTRIGRLDRLRHLFFEVDRLTPPVAEALGHLPQLRMLSIKRTGDRDRDSDILLSHDCLLAIGRMSELEDLSLEDMSIGRESFKCLAGLINLKSLQLHTIFPETSGQTIKTSPPMLEYFPPLPRLETIILTLSWIGDRDLQHLARLPRLKTLSLWGTSASDAGLRELAAFNSLEELAIDDGMVTIPGLRSLLAVKRLNKLHFNTWPKYYGDDPQKLAKLILDRGSEITVPARDLAAYQRAVKALRSSKPGIVVDGAASLGYIAEQKLPWSYETLANHRAPIWRVIGNLPSLPPRLRDQIESAAVKAGVTTSF